MKGRIRASVFAANLFALGSIAACTTQTSTGIVVVSLKGCGSTGNGPPATQGSTVPDPPTILVTGSSSKRVEAADDLRSRFAIPPGRYWLMTQEGIPGTIQQGWVSASVVVRAGVTSRVALPAECIFPGD